MTFEVNDNTAVVTASPLWRRMPPRVRVLYVATPARGGGWLADAFAADSASQVVLEEAAGMAAAVTRLGDEVFDAVLIHHQPPELDALELCEGYRAGGAEEPLVVLGNAGEHEMAVWCYEAGADGYLCLATATTRHLLWVVARAVERHRLVRASARLQQAEQQRLLREQDEAKRILQQQRAVIVQGEPSSAPIAFPPELVDHYRELLRTCVIMGSGSPGAELRQLADVLVTAGLSARQAMDLHLQVTAEMVQGLGPRSSRHVLTRADLLALELAASLADGYRQRIVGPH
jgi:DNA-binding response OmpR family regulator